MSKKIDESQKKQIRNLLLVLAGAISFAVVFGLFMLMNYGPSGRYDLKSALLSPETASALTYNDLNNSGASTRYIFNSFELQYFDSTQNKMVKVPVDSDQYYQFYNLIGGDTSVPEVSQEIEKQFRGNIPKLSIMVRPEGDSSQATKKVFQDVQFAPEGDYYRVQLRDANPSGGWAYFYHPHLYQNAFNILTIKQ